MSGNFGKLIDLICARNEVFVEIHQVSLALLVLICVVRRRVSVCEHAYEPNWMHVTNT